LLLLLVVVVIGCCCNALFVKTFLRLVN